jgi:rubrerythrin
MNVYDFAIQMETDAETFYRKLAADRTIPGINKIFSDLADDEQRHRQLFQALKEQQMPDAVTDSRVLEKAKNIFEKILNEKQNLPSLSSNLESYRYALKLEAEGVRLYTDAANRESSGEIKQLLLRIAKEEENHFNIVENIYNFVNAPNQYLAWAEFNSLGEFQAFGRETDL